MIKEVFGNIIDQATINITEQRQLYHETLEKKYGEPPDQVLSRLRPSDQPLAAVQLANEMAQIEAKRRLNAESQLAVALKRASDAEKTLGGMEQFRKKMEAKKQSGRRKAKKQKSKSKKRKK